jgi:sensor domain CHASE-containing protein
VKNITIEKWVSWIIATATAALTMAAYAFTTFETKDHAKEVKDDLTKRLEKMDSKLDILLTK